MLSGPPASWTGNQVRMEGALAFLCFLFPSLPSSLPFLLLQMSLHGVYRLVSEGPWFPF